MDDAVAVQDFVQYWKPILKQKVALACYRHGSDEIVGLNMNYVTLKDEHFWERLLPQVNIFQLNLDFFQKSTTFHQTLLFSIFFYFVIRILYSV